jgi:hypothetical protein
MSKIRLFQQSVWTNFVKKDLQSSPFLFVHFIKKCIFCRLSKKKWWTLKIIFHKVDPKSVKSNNKICYFKLVWYANKPFCSASKWFETHKKTHLNVLIQISKFFQTGLIQNSKTKTVCYDLKLFKTVIFWHIKPVWYVIKPLFPTFCIRFFDSLVGKVFFPTNDMKPWNNKFLAHLSH